MYNDWMFRVSVGDYRAQDSVNYEAIGTAPDEHSKTKKKIC